MQTATRFLAFTSSIFGIVSAYNNVVVQNLKLFDGNDEFFIKGMCYSPAPLGYNNLTAGYVNGAGLCSDRQHYAPGSTGAAVTTSACAYEDFFDGAVLPGGPSGPWFKALWDRDFPTMKTLGVNTIRIYHTNPITKMAVAQNPTMFTTPNLGADHIPFMDAALAEGFKVIFPIYAEQALLTAANLPTLEFYIRNIVDEVGNHSALLMWQCGNELPIFGDGTQPLLDLLNHMFDYTRNYTLERWNRVIPVSIALVDNPFSYNNLTRDLRVDILTTNAGYRGPTYSNLWSGSTDPNLPFYGMQRLSCQYNKPVFIGEIGQHSTDGFINDLDWFTSNWKDLLNNTVNGAIGGAFFEFNDEMWKAPNQQHMGVLSVSANGNSLQKNGWDADTYTPKPDSTGAYAFSAAQTALNIDPYAYLGRARYTLATAPSICANVAPIPSAPPTSTSSSYDTTSSSTVSSSSTVASSTQTSTATGSTTSDSNQSSASSTSSNGSATVSSTASSNGSSSNTRVSESTSGTTVPPSVPTGLESSAWFLSAPILIVCTLVALF